VIGTATAISALTIKGLMDHEESRLSEKQLSDQNKLRDTQISSLQAQLLDMTQVTTNLKAQLENQEKERLADKAEMFEALSSIKAELAAMKNKENNKKTSFWT
jgi:hypothetical protein